MAACAGTEVALPAPPEDSPLKIKPFELLEVVVSAIRRFMPDDVSKIAIPDVDTPLPIAQPEPTNVVLTLKTPFPDVLGVTVPETVQLGVLAEMDPELEIVTVAKLAVEVAVMPHPVKLPVILAKLAGVS